jgi:hypothetical protein
MTDPDPDPRTAADDDEDATFEGEHPSQAEGDDDIAPEQPGSPQG